MKELQADFDEHASHGSARTAPKWDAESTTDSPAHFRENLQRRGWRQGSFLNSILGSEVRPVPFANPVPDEARYLVISQDCDVIHGNVAAEPAVEVVAVTPILQCDPTCQNLRNPRELHVHVSIADDDSRPSAIRVWGRGFIDRSLLGAHDPDASISISHNDLRDVVDFVGRRYDREAFPDEFVRRFKKTQKKLEMVLRTHADRIVDLYVIVEPFTELPRMSTEKNPGDSEASQLYRVWMDVVVEQGLMDGDPSVLNAMKNGVKPGLRKAITNCAGIELEDLVFRGPEEITLARWRKMHRLDFDAMSSEERPEQRAGPRSS